MRILVVKKTSIGDLAHTLPLVWSLTHRGWALPNGVASPGGVRRSISFDPDTDSTPRVDWMVGPEAAPIVELLPWVDHAVVVDTVRWNRRQAVREWWQAAVRLRRGSYDLVVDFQGLARSSLWTIICGAPLRIGRGRWPWLHYRISMYDPATLHAIENTARCLAPLGTDPRAVLRPFLSDGAAQIVEPLIERGRQLRQQLALPGPLWAWIPQSRWPAKTLSSQHLELAPEGASHVLLADGSWQHGVPSTGRWVSLAGRVELMESVALALVAEWVIAVDTGPAQLAALLGARIDGCFAPTDRRRSGLRGPRARNYSGEIPQGQLPARSPFRPNR